MAQSSAAATSPLHITSSWRWLWSQAMAASESSVTLPWCLRMLMNSKAHRRECWSSHGQVSQIHGVMYILWSGYMKLHLCNEQLLLSSQCCALNGHSVPVSSTTRRIGRLEHLHAQRNIRDPGSWPRIIQAAAEGPTSSEGSNK